MQKIFLLLISYVLIVPTSIASAQENLFKKNFQRQSPTDFQSFEKTIDTKIMKGWDQDKDKIKMLEEGFDLMGFSGFSGPNISLFPLLFLRPKCSYNFIVCLNKSSTY